MTLAEQIAIHKAAAEAKAMATTGTAPQGLAEQIEAHKKSNKPAEPWYEDFAEGVGVSGLSTYYGLKDLFTDLDDEDRATLADWKEDARESGWGVGGQIAGDVGQLFIPAGGLLKATKLAGQASKVGKGLNLTTKLIKANPIKAGALNAGVLAGLKLPDADETRLGNATRDAAAAVVGGGVMKGLAKAAKGITKSKAGQQLLDEGVPLTVGQAAESKSVQGVESLMELTPLLSQKTKALQDTAAKAWDLNFINKAAPKGVRITKTGREGFDQLKGAVNSAYKKAWGKAGKVPEGTKESLQNIVIKNLDDFDVKEARVLYRIFDDVEKLTTGGNPKQLKSLDNALRKEIAKAKNSPELQRVIQGMRDELRDRLPKEARNALKEIDKTYPKYLTVKKATAAAHANKGNFSPKQASQASKTVGGETKAASDIDGAPLMKAAEAGIETLGNSGRGELLGWVRRALNTVPSIAPLESMGKVLLGQTPGQKLVDKGLETATGKALRAAVPKTAAAYAGSEDLN